MNFANKRVKCVDLLHRVAETRERKSFLARAKTLAQAQSPKGEITIQFNYWLLGPERFHS